ncbi:MAG: M48 family metalloprotease [Bacteroidota bacterium]
MATTRRNVLAGLTGWGLAGFALPAWGQAIGAQSDPWAQVDPYADPRNGFPSERRAIGGGASAGDGPFRRAAESTADDQDEIAVGRMAYPSRIKRGGGAYADAKVQQALRDFCRPLFAASDRPELPWVVTLVNTAEPNANAGAGGTVIVNGGILPLFDHPTQFAAVLAHEIGHVDYRHVTRGTDIGLLAQIARKQGVTTNGDAAMTALMPEVQGSVKDFMDLMDKTFSREDEAEADAHVVEIFDRIGIDPARAADGMRAILKMEQRTGSGAPNQWVSEHPLTPDRIRHMEALAATRRRPSTDYAFAGWDVLKAAFPTHPDFRKA